MAKELSPLELAKRSVNPYDGEAVFARLSKGTVADITPEDDVVMKWHGLYRQRPPEAGRFTLRLKLPNGGITAAQAAVVAAIAGRCADGRIALTTRQNMSVHSLALADLAGVFAELKAAGLTTLGACGDAVRNVIGCPAAGLDPNELLDVQPTVDAVTAAFLGNPEYGNLPRKLKVAISGCACHCVPTAINDIGLEASRGPAGEVGYTVFVAGGLSSSPTFARPIGWILPEDAVPLVAAIASLFREHGNRDNRSRARTKYLVAEWGIERYRSEVEARLGHPLAPAPEGAAPAGPSRDHLGVHPQRQAGLNMVGVPVPAGRLSAKQLGALAGLAARSGSGCLRVTQKQNILLPDIAAASLDAVLSTLAECGLPASDERWAGHLVVCTGREFCNKAMVTTKATAIRLLDALESAIPGAPVTLGMSGCPNGCAQHHLADIGLSGAAVKGEGGMEERFDLWVAGGPAAGEAMFARRIRTKMLPAELPAVIAALIARYRAEAAGGESFSGFARRVLWPEAEKR